MAKTKLFAPPIVSKTKSSNFKIMFFMFYGPNIFLSRQQLKKSIEDFKKRRDKSGINIAIFEADKTTGAQIFEALTTLPFLGEKRLVVVKNLLKTNNKDLFKSLDEALEQKKIPDTTVAIFWEEDLSEKKLPELFDFLKKQKYSKFFAPLSGASLSKWIKEQLDLSGVAIERYALEEIANHNLSQDLELLSNYLAQMSAYTLGLPEKNINLKIVDLFLPGSPDDNSFHFLDALVARDRKKAIKLLHDQWLSENAEAAVFGALIWQFKNLLIIKDFLLSNPGATSDNIARNLKISPFVVKKSLSALRVFDFEKLKMIYRNLLEIDKQVKTGESNYPLLLDLLVAKVCG